MRTFSLRPFTVLILYLICLVFLLNGQADPDLWGHLKFGEHTFSHGLPPHADIYSYTMPGAAWMNHEWFSELLFYSFYRCLGNGGLFLLKGLLAALLLFLVFRFHWKRKIAYFPLFMVVLLATQVLSDRFLFRPQIFTLFFFSSFLYLFFLYDEGKRRSLLCVPPIMLLWVNSHGGFLMGIGILGIFVLFQLFQRKKPEERYFLCGIMAAALVCTLLNPYGLELHLFLKNSLTVPRKVTEWQPLRMDLEFPILKFLLLVTPFILIFSRQKKKPWRVALLLTTMYLALAHMRHLGLFAVAVLYFLPVHLEDLLERKFSVKKRDKIVLPMHKQKRIAAVFAVVFLSSMAFLWWEMNFFRVHFFDVEYPRKAVEFLKSKDLSGNLLTQFSWGQYAIWHLHPHFKVAYDGRFRTVYPLKIENDYLALAYGTVGWKNMLEEYPTDIVLWPQKHPVTRLIREEWHEIYRDELAAVFVQDKTLPLALNEGGAPERIRAFP